MVGGLITYIEGILPVDEDFEDASHEQRYYGTTTIGEHEMKLQYEDDLRNYLQLTSSFISSSGIQF